MMERKILSEASLLEAVSELTARDPDLAGVVARYGPPPLWARPPGFPTLIHIILEQQVSLASALAAFERLKVAAAPLSPETFLTLDDETLLAVGFSRQKARYGRILAAAVLSGELDLPALEAMDDDGIRAALCRITGIGPWTAEIYLLMVLLRPDAWPRSDLALATAARRVKGLPGAPGPSELEQLGELWHPYRAAAARLLWHDYLSQPRKARMKEEG
jgi:DNA-3-methyladenine glycosylase II